MSVKDDWDKLYFVVLTFLVGVILGAVGYALLFGGGS